MNCGPLGSAGWAKSIARAHTAERTAPSRFFPRSFLLSSSQATLRARSKTISSLNHPHICVLHDVGSHDGIDYLVMECVEGETLAKRLGRDRCRWTKCSNTGANRRCAGQGASQRVVHRDLNQGMSCYHNGASFLDFGLPNQRCHLRA